MHNRFLCARAMKEGKNVKPTVIPSKSHSAVAVFILLEGNLPKPGNPYCGPTDRPTNKQLTDQQTTNN